MVHTEIWSQFRNSFSCPLQRENKISIALGDTICVSLAWFGYPVVHHSEFLQEKKYTCGNKMSVISWDVSSKQKVLLDFAEGAMVALHVR